MSSNNPIGRLQEMHQQGLQKNPSAAPTYNLIESSGEDHGPTFKMEATFRGLSAVGEGSTKKQAKTLAAAKLLSLIEESKTGEKVEENTAADKPAAAIPANFLGNKVGELQEYCSSKQLISPWYEEVAVDGPPHMRMFTIRCELGHIKKTAESPTKKSAKRDASHLVLEELKTLSDPELLQLKNTERMKKEKEARSESESIVKVDIDEAKVIEGSAEGIKEEDKVEGEEKGDGSMGVWNPAEIQADAIPGLDAGRLHLGQSEEELAAENVVRRSSLKSNRQ